MMTEHALMGVIAALIGVIAALKRRFRGHFVASFFPSIRQQF